MMKLKPSLTPDVAGIIMDTALADGRDENLLPLTALADGQFVPVPGGVLIEDVDEFAIGAIGISGDTSEKDEYCALRAVQDAGLQAEPPQIDPEWQSSSLSDHEDK